MTWSQVTRGCRPVVDGDVEMGQLKIDALSIEYSGGLTLTLSRVLERGLGLSPNAHPSTGRGVDLRLMLCQLSTVEASP